MGEALVKRAIIDAIGMAYRRGLITSTGGNISIRAEGRQRMWITPRSLPKTALKPSDLVLASFSGKRIKGRRDASIEWPFHSAIYRTRSDVNAIVHTHNPLTMGIVASAEPLEFLTVEAEMIIKKILVLPYRSPGSKDLADLVAQAVKESNVLILERHGVVAVGRNLDEACSLVEVLEEAATTQTVARLFSISTKT